MPESSVLERFVASARVDPQVFALRPDYRVMLVAVDGLTPGAAAAASDALLDAAEAAARRAVAERRVEEIAHVAAWRDAYRAFGAKPQRTRNSLEALLRRADSGLPRVNGLTDVYNAISAVHQVPLGGEDLTAYQGPARLVRAVGDERFDTVADGSSVVEHPDAGEVVWRDDVGVTCRRWNWRQGRRTRLTDSTSTALFLFDALEPMTDDALRAAADALVGALTPLGRSITTAERLIAAP